MTHYFEGFEVDHGYAIIQGAGHEGVGTKFGDYAVATLTEGEMQGLGGPPGDDIFPDVKDDQNPKHPAYPMDVRSRSRTQRRMRIRQRSRNGTTSSGRWERSGCRYSIRLVRESAKAKSSEGGTSRDLGGEYRTASVAIK